MRIPNRQARGYKQNSRRQTDSRKESRTGIAGFDSAFRGGTDGDETRKCGRVRMLALLVALIFPVSIPPKVFVLRMMRVATVFVATTLFAALRRGRALVHFAAIVGG